MSFNDMEVDDESNFLKIAPDQSVQFNILTNDPIKKITHWIDKKPTLCEGKRCDLCSQGNKPRKSWTAKVFDRKSGNIKEFEFGPQIANQLKNISQMLTENQQSIHDVDIRVKREGSMLDTEYLVIHVPKTPLPDDLPPF